jgi:phage baseplate assembly protein W
MPDLSFDLGGDLGGDTPSLSSPKFTQSRTDFFGVDLLFTDDLQVTSSSDYAEISDFDALKQAVRCRLLTSPGEYAVNPSYGCGLRQFVKKRASQSDRDALRQIIIDQLAQEERIQNVEEVTVESLTSGTMTGVKIFIRIIALGRENSFNVQTFAE